MTKTALKALKASIKHWERMRDNIRGQEEMPCADDCPLCREYALSVIDHWCEGCPVKETTRQTGCRGSPFGAAYKAFINGSSEQWKAAAQAEIDFLKSLLPKNSELINRD